jgi:hypothetical protein
LPTIRGIKCDSKNVGIPGILVGKSTMLLSLKLSAD